ncbi:MAG: ABC transporter permease [Nitrososphaerales archaeon]
MRIGGDVELALPPLFIIAKKEFRDSITNRWFLILSAIFFLLILQIPYIVLMLLGLFPYANIPGKVGTFITAAISLGALITIILGSLSISGEKEQGTLTYLLSQPVRRIEVLLGKFLGLLLAISLIMVVGFGVALFPSFGESYVAEMGLQDFAYGILAMVGLSMVMLGISLAISVVSLSRTMAVSVALLIWLLLTVIYDAGLLGLVFIATGETQAFLYFILLNPVQITQITAYLLIRPEFSAGLSVQFMIRYFGSGVFVPLTAAMLIWLFAAISFSTIEFYFRDQ